jgi:hypothetical protein
MFSKGYLFLIYDQDNDKLGVSKFESMWFGTFILKLVLKKGSYELVNYQGNPLDELHNGIYLKRYYA